MPRTLDNARLTVTHNPTQRLDFENPKLVDDPPTLEETLHGLVDALTSIVGMTLEGLGAVITGITSAVLTSAAAIWQLLVKLPLIGDFIEVITGIEDGDPNDLGTFTNGLVSDIRTMVDNLVSGLFGWIGHSWTNEDAKQAIADAATTIAGLSSAVTALQRNQNNQAIGGRSAMIDLTLRPTAATFGADFAHTRPGPGVGHYEIVNGLGGRWIAANDDNSTDAFTYLDLTTATDYQKVWMAFSSAPMWWNDSTKARNEIHGRKNLAGDSYVFAGLEKNRADIGCVVAGARTVFTTKTTGFSFKSTAPYALELGTIAGIRIFRILEGNTVVMVHTEVGTTSMVGPDYRSWGGKGSGLAWWLGVTPPATVIAIAGADNYPPTLVGSGAQMSRTNTGVYSLAAGTNPLPPNFWNNAGPKTDDIGRDIPLGRFTATRKDWYRVTARIAIVEAELVVPKRLDLVLYRGTGAGSSAPADWMSPGAGAYHNGSTLYTPSAVYGSVDVYLDVSDFVELGYNVDGAVGQFTGDASGGKTWISITATGNPNRNET